MIGKLLGNRYEIIEQIGGGGMALVYKAKCRLLDRFVAIKVLRDEFTNDEDFIRKFRRESQAAASLSHPNILNIYDVGVEEDGAKNIYYIVMEFINGKTLKEVIQEKGKLTVDETLYYSLQIAEALQHAHNNHIVHRDIKPHNIMVTVDNRVKVTDFGIARAVTSSTVTTSSNVLGSVHYFSPEQARGGYTDEKSDIYSLGILMYEMITGKLPFEADSPISVALKHVQEEIVPPRDLDTTIPFSLEAIILRCVQKRQSDRYANISDLIADLNSIKSYGKIGSNGNSNDFDSNTRLIPKIETEDEVLDKVRKDKPNKKKKKKDGSLMIIFSAILLAFLLVTITFMGYAKLKGFLAVEEVPVPYLVGLEESNADATLKDLGLVLKVNDRVKSTKFKLGEIISQDVSDGMNVKKGSSIGVTISEGQDLVKVPLVINKSLLEAEELIKVAGLKMGVPEYAYNETVPVDFVISQDPDALSERQPGTKINLVVSQGAEIKPVFMPKVVGMPINEARNTLVGLDLVIGEIKPQPSNDVAPDIVIWQEYDQGTELESKTSVDLYISSGPEEAPPVEEPVEPEEETGSITLTLTPLADRDETEIKVFLKHDGITEVIYNKKHKASEGAVVRTFTGKVGSQIEVHFDGIFQGSQTITKE